jgi:hypothetical protein
VPREDEAGVAPPIPRWLKGAFASAALVAAITGVIALLEPRVPAPGLGALYLFAVVPIALGYVAATDEERRRVVRDRRGPRTTRSRSRCATTASEAPGPTAAA